MAATRINQKSDAPSSVSRAGEVFDEHGSFIRSAIRFHVKNEAEAEDLFQDLFLHLVAKPIPEEVHNTKGFLYKLICDAAKDTFRSADRYQTRIRKYAQRNVRAVDNGPENGLMEVEEVRRMFDLIRTHLPPKEALAVTLRHKDNCDTGEVAKRMGVKPRSVSRYVSVGLKKMGHVLGERQESNYDNR